MDGKRNSGQDALPRKRSASNQSRDGRPPAKKIAAPPKIEEDVQDLSLIAEEVKATVRTLYTESNDVKQYFWQATAFPQKLAKMLASIEENVNATFAPNQHHPIYLKHSIAGSESFLGSIRTGLNCNRFKIDLDNLVEQMKLDYPKQRITVVVLIYRDGGNYSDNWEQRALINGLRDDLNIRQGGMEVACEVSNLTKQLKESEEAVKTWNERTIMAEKKISGLQATLREKDRAIAVLDGGIPNPDIDNLKEEIGRRDRQYKEAMQQRDEVIRQRDEAIQQRDEAIRQRDEAIEQRGNLQKKRDRYEEELQDDIAEANQKIKRLEEEVSATRERQGDTERNDDVSGLKQSLQKREQQVANLQAIIQDRNEAIWNRDQEIARAAAGGKAREEGLRRKLKDPLDEKYAREREDFEREKKEIEQKMERRRQEDLESLGPCQNEETE